MSGFAVARAFIRKDWRESLARRGSHLLGGAGIAATLVFLSGLSRSTGGGATAPEDAAAGGSFGFLVVGIALFAVHDALVRELPRRVRRLQLEGTLEPVLAARAGLGAVACSLPLFPLLRALVRAGALLAAGALLLDLRLEPRGVPAALGLLVAAIPLFAAIGVAASAAVLLWGRAEAAIALYGTLSALFGGVFFPAEALPAPLAPLAGAVPLAHVLGPLRGALLGAVEPAAMVEPFIRVAAAGALLLPASLLLLRAAHRRALGDGVIAAP